jgi:hypothetical protein
LSESAADAPDAVAAGDEVQDVATRVRRSRPIALLLEIGAVAGALASIGAIVVTVVQAVSSSDGPATSSTKITAKVTLGVGARSVQILTFREYLRAYGIDPNQTDKPEELDDVGFMVRYSATTSGYPAGTKLGVRFQLWERSKSGERFVGPAVWDSIEVERDPDSCGCESTFIKLVRPNARYRLEIGLFAPGVRRGRPLKRAEPEFGGASRS